MLLPITDHIVRILDGKIDAQGSPAELRAAGQLDGLIAVEEAEVTAEEPVVNADEKQNEEVEALDGEAAAAAADKKAKKQNRPGKKLVQGRFAVFVFVSGVRARTSWLMRVQTRSGP